MTASRPAPRPVDLARALLDALDATEGRRRRRKRNTGADAIGIAMKKALLEGVIRDDPDPAGFEGWLLERCFEQGPGEGAWRAMALEIFDEWRLAAAAPDFRRWLAAGAPSDDKPAEGRRRETAPALARPGLPILLALLAMAPLAACHGGIEADPEDVPEIEVAALEGEAIQAGGMTSEVLRPLLAGPGPDSTTYDAPVSLARPPGARVWPPPAGSYGDEAAGRVVPDSVASPAPDTAGGGSGGSGGSETGG